eukprot:1393297-Pleurochrysis_carterae.AAC.3
MCGRECKRVCKHLHVRTRVRMRAQALLRGCCWMYGSFGANGSAQALALPLLQSVSEHVLVSVLPLVSVASRVPPVSLIAPESVSARQCNSRHCAPVLAPASDCATQRYRG